MTFHTENGAVSAQPARIRRLSYRYPCAGLILGVSAFCAPLAWGQQQGTGTPPAPSPQPSTPAAQPLPTPPLPPPPPPPAAPAQGAAPPAAPSAALPHPPGYPPGAVPPAGPPTATYPQPPPASGAYPYPYPYPPYSYPYGQYPYPYPPGAQARQLPPSPPGPPEVLDYDESKPVPPGYRVKELPRTTTVAIGGAILLLGYLPTAYVGLIGTTLGGEGFDALLIPVVGPFVVMGTADINASGGFWLALSGATQTAGIVTGIVGLVMPGKKMLYRNHPPTARLSIEPMVGPAQGLSVRGTF